MLKCLKMIPIPISPIPIIGEVATSDQIPWHVRQVF